MSDWYSVTCEQCGDEIHAHTSWDCAPRFCPSCKEKRAAEWYDKDCERCGTTIRARHDWEKPPRFCKTCKAKEEAEWYDKACERCGTAIRARHDWEKPPRFCKKCKAKQAANKFEITCDGCGLPFPVSREWSHLPTICNRCKEQYPARMSDCAHCGDRFEISAQTQIACRQKGWELPKRCPKCRELFKHKPFRTERRIGLAGDVVFRTYNSRGELLSESRDEKWLGSDVRRHKSMTGKSVGFTHQTKDILGQPERVTRSPDGSVKSRSYETTGPLGDRRTVSIGGASKTKHLTRTVASFFGFKFRKTE